MGWRKGLHSPPPGKRSGPHWLSDTQRYFSSFCGGTGSQVYEGLSLGPGQPISSHSLPQVPVATASGGWQVQSQLQGWTMGLYSCHLPCSGQYASVTCSTHLWTESLHLIFSNDHLGDNDKDRGALGRRRERKKPIPICRSGRDFSSTEEEVPVCL